MLASQATSLKDVSQTCTNIQDSLQFTQADVTELQSKNKELENENALLKNRIMGLEKSERSKSEN